MALVLRILVARSVFHLATSFFLFLIALYVVYFQFYFYSVWLCFRGDMIFFVRTFLLFFRLENTPGPQSIVHVYFNFRIGNFGTACRPVGNQLFLYGLMSVLSLLFYLSYFCFSMSSELVGELWRTRA